MEVKMHYLLFSVVAISLSFSNAAIIKGGIEIPTYAEPCRRNSNGFDDCIKNTLQQLIPKFSKGIPDLNISALDPFYLDEYLLSYDAGEIAGKCLFKGSLVHGLLGVKITGVRSDVSNPDKFEMEIDFDFPKIIGTGNYKCEGRIGNFPVAGKGFYNVTSFNVTGIMHLVGRSIEIEGEKHIKITEVDLKEHEIGDLKLYATNLINGNPELSQLALTFANQFWRVLHQLMLPNIQEGFDKVGRPFINQLFLQIPYDQLLPPSRK